MTKYVSETIKMITMQADKIVNRLAAKHNLTFSQLKILFFLYRSKDKEIHQIDIEKHYLLTNPTVTGILQSLEKKGYIIRKTSKKDSRCKTIHLTTKNLDFENVNKKITEEIESVLTNNLSSDEKQTLLKLLNKVKLNLM